MPVKSKKFLLSKSALKPKDTKAAITLALIGDVMLGRGVNQVISERSPAELWGNVLPILPGADAVIANLESTITQSQQQCRWTFKAFYFRADPAAVAVLQIANIRWVSLANNHILDFDDQGLLETLEVLDRAGIQHGGAGRNLQEAMPPSLLTVGDRRVGVLALTDNEPAFAATRDRPGTHYRPIDLHPSTLDWLQAAVAHLRAWGSELILLSAHWGPNMVLMPPPEFRAFAQAVLAAGVDLFYGHSAHLFQGVEGRDRGLILYDTGDFLDDYAVDPALRNDWSFIFLVDVTAQGLARLRLVPVCLRYAGVDLAEGEEFAAICQRMQRLSEAFQTPLQQTPTGLEVQLGA